MDGHLYCFCLRCLSRIHICQLHLEVQKLKTCVKLENTNTNYLKWKYNFILIYIYIHICIIIYFINETDTKVKQNKFNDNQKDSWQAAGNPDRS